MQRHCSLVILRYFMRLLYCSCVEFFYNHKAMEWKGMARYGKEWLGMAWKGMMRHGKAWQGKAWKGMMRHGKAWQSMEGQGLKR